MQMTGAYEPHEPMCLERMLGCADSRFSCQSLPWSRAPACFRPTRSSRRRARHRCSIHLHPNRQCMSSSSMGRLLRQCCPKSESRHRRNSCAPTRSSYLATSHHSAHWSGTVRRPRPARPARGTWQAISVELPRSFVCGNPPCRHISHTGHNLRRHACDVCGARGETSTQNPFEMFPSVYY